MISPFQRLSSLVRLKRLAVAVAIGVGLLYGLPNIFFIFGDFSSYRGIPLLQTPNEGSYLGRIQEIVDGHGAVSSPFFFEYKEGVPLSPSTGEWVYALPAILFGISPATVLVVSKFFFPPILFLLVYALAFRLAQGEGRSREAMAIACGLLVTLGYDLVDYRTMLSYVSGSGVPNSFLLWARPVNPILGALFLFSFLLSVLAIVQNTIRRKTAIVTASVFLALMFGSYFFSWGTAFSVLVLLILILVARKKYATAGNLTLVIPFGILLASPYWYGAWQATHSPWYASSVLRSGLFLTHYPLWNKFLLATLFFFAVILAFDFLWKKRRGIEWSVETWHCFNLSLLLGGIWTYSQQILTGETIWPYHFVQYTIPLAMLVLMVSIYNCIRPMQRYLSNMFVSGVILLSVCLGVYTQVQAYTAAVPYYARMQVYKALFDFLNTREKECVVFVNETDAEMSELNTLIPAFTHCNRYVSTEMNSLIPDTRGEDGYLALLRLRGILPVDIDEYIRAHRSEASGYLFSNWQGLFGVKDFPDFSDPVLEERLSAFPERYRAFLTKEFRTELQKYRLDFILSDSSLDGEVLLRIPGLTKVFTSAGKSLCAF
ncbi:MAG: hypothetical protein EXS51_00510 [Candidatus Taylorbacteria bacterium]|nr:hypothetical protein [Candidatus Taylorbacteria bacterium]